MVKQVVLESPSATLWYYPSERIVHHQFHGFVRSAELRAVLSRGLEVMREHGATKWLSDDRRNGALCAEDREWLEQVWRPAAVAAGWKAWAMVLPEAVVGQMAVRRSMDALAALGLTVKAFDSPVPALAWLVKA